MAKPISFETSIVDLESIVMQLEKGELSLGEALKQYEKGIGLARTCQATLAQAEQKIAALSPPLPIEGNLDDE